MTNRGRESFEDKQLAPLGELDKIEAHERPAPPHDLTEEQAELWHTIVDRLPPDWFRPETLPLLIQLCRLVSRANVTADGINAMQESSEKLSLSEYKELVKFEIELTDQIVHLMTKMRLTQQSIINKKRVKDKTSQNPWEM